jgi:hypothetical protein
MSALFSPNNSRSPLRIAGSDTSSTSLSYFLWELSRRPDVLKKLQQEVDDNMPDAHSILDINVLNKLPYLNSFIKEGEHDFTPPLHGLMTSQVCVSTAPLPVFLSVLFLGLTPP